ncbi:MAG: hypothetical protein IJD68_05575 [Ruminococcus sp.]|nr:hypothetical protein [Ruminococcus sp.]
MKRFALIFSMLLCLFLSCVFLCFSDNVKAVSPEKNDDIVMVQNHLTEQNASVNEQQCDYAVSLFNRIYDEQLSDLDCYFVLIPDKYIYLSDSKESYDKTYDYMCNSLSRFKPIDVYDLLCADDYFYTDMHLRQECITDVAKRINESMGNSFYSDFKKSLASENFLGDYAQKYAKKVDAEELFYLTNKQIDKLYTKENIPIYDFEMLKTNKLYEFFLSGNQSIVTIKNDNAQSDKRLIIFRDSFASNIAPLLTFDYSEVVLVDLRYILSDVVPEYVDYSNSDVLFMYSTALINNSLSMK